MPRTDAKRFSRLVEPHLDALFRAAYRLSRNQADAEDLSRRPVSGPASESISSGTRGLSRRGCSEYCTTFSSTRRDAQRAPFDRGVDGTDIVAESASPDPTPEESRHTAEREAELERAWRRLERGHRALLALRAEGYSLPEIAEITNLAIDALTMRLYRARQTDAPVCSATIQQPSHSESPGLRRGLTFIQRG